MALVEQLPRARRQILDCYIHHEIDSRRAAALLGVSQRQFWRLLAAYREHGEDALSHGNRGRRPGNAIAAEVAARIVVLARERYPDANHTHLAELLAEREGITISRQTLRRILTAAGLKSPRRRRPPRHRVRRERMPREGMLVQVDGSHHRWLGADHPQFVLHLAVDDATGRVLAANFRPDEDSCGYFELLGDLIREHGIPLALYSDRHSVFVPALRSHRPKSAEGATQFARAMSELGIRQVFAGSAQAKGRVERACGTFQDRLVTELRLAGVTTIVGANYLLGKFLESFNRRFAVAPAQTQTAYRPLDPGIELDLVLCFRHSRRVFRDNTVRYRWQSIQLLPARERPSYAGCRVEVIEHTNGRLQIALDGRIIPSQLCPPKPGLMRISGADRDPDRLQRQLAKVAQLPEVVPAGKRRRRGSADRKPTARQVARWEAVQAARAKGMNITAIARELGISRHTVRKYVKATEPPRNKTRRTGAIEQQQLSEPVD
jgi:transposase